MSAPILDQVVLFLSENLDLRLSYHNAVHTTDVCQAAQMIGMAEGLDEADMRKLLIAAAYHDSGFVIGHVGHEEESVRICFDQTTYLSETDKLDIEQMILATKPSAKPTSKMEMIIKDADLDYLGRADFIEISDRLYQENLAFGKVVSRKQWDQMQIAFMTEHRFYTDFSKANREARKADNLALIKRNAF